MLEKAGKVGFSGLTEKPRIEKKSRIGRKQAREVGSVGPEPPLRPYLISCPLEESDALSKPKFKVTETWGSWPQRFSGKQCCLIKR